MQWLLPLGALLAFAVMAALVSRNPIPLQPLEQPPTQNAPWVQPEQKTNSAVRDKQNADRLGDSPLPTQLPAARHAGADNSADHDNHGTEEGTEFWPSFLGVRLKVTDSLLALFTLALAVFTYRLWKATESLWTSAENQLGEFRKSLTQAQTIANIEAAHMASYVVQATRSAEAAEASLATMTDTAVRQLRAYVLTRVVNSDPTLSVSKRYVVIYNVHNSGQSPASVIEIARAVDVFPYPLPKDYVLPAPVEIAGSGVVIGPHETLSAGTILAARTFSSAEINSIQSKHTHRIYYYGMLSYMDAFGKRRQSDFCCSLVWGALMKTPDGTIHTTWDITEGRNKSD